jgi:hypothetical protein
MLAEAPSRLARSRDGLVEMTRAVERRGGHRLAARRLRRTATRPVPADARYDHFRDALQLLDETHLPSDLGPIGETPSGTRMALAGPPWLFWNRTTRAIRISSSSPMATIRLVMASGDRRG